MSSPTSALTTVDGFALSRSEIEQVVEYVFAHRKEAVQQFLAEHSFPTSGLKDDLRDRVTNGLKSKAIIPEELIALLDTIEGWGNQHIYLYSAPPGELKIWKKKQEAVKRMTKAGNADLFNQCRPLVLPANPTLSSVEWTPQRVRCIWVEKREWEMRVPDEDSQDKVLGIFYKAYQQQIARGITTFDWNLVTGEAALMIQRLPSGEGYNQIRQVYERELEPFITISNFTRVRTRRAIRNLEKVKETLNRQIEHETLRGGKAAFTSKGRESDAYADPDLKKSRDALGGRAVSVLGNFYFLPAKQSLSRNIHIKIYAKDQRVGIFGECTEDEVSYVLSRIRHHCK